MNILTILMFPLLFSVFHPNEVQKKDNASFFSVFGYAICKRTGRIINIKKSFPPQLLAWYSKEVILSIVQHVHYSISITYVWVFHKYLNIYICTTCMHHYNYEKMCKWKSVITIDMVSMFRFCKPPLSDSLKYADTV